MELYCEGDLDYLADVNLGWLALNEVALFFSPSIPRRGESG